MGEDWVNISIPESVQEQARGSELPYHRLIVKGLRAENNNLDDQIAIEKMRERLDEWERELRSDSRG